MNDDSILDQPCDYCEASAGYPCRDRHNRVCAPHATRKRAAHDAVVAERDQP